MYKNAIIYKLDQELEATDVEKKLSSFPTQIPTALQESTIGFDYPDYYNQYEFTATVQGVTHFSVKTNEKILPAAVVKDYVAELQKAYEEDSLTLATKKVRAALKDTALAELLPRAFVKSTVVQGYIDTTNSIIALNTASFKRAEDCVSLLRKALGSLYATPYATNTPPRVFMTLNAHEGAQLPDGFQPAGKYVLTVEDTKARFSDCEHEDFRELLDRGAQVNAMSFQLDETIEFLLDDQLRLKSIKGLTVPDEDVEPCFASEALLSQSMVTGTFFKVVKALGGEITL